MSRHGFPGIHFYDQDFVDIYDRTWALISDCWITPPPAAGFGSGRFFYHPDRNPVLEQDAQIFASFFLVYSNRLYSCSSGLDALYAKQEPNGAIRAKYDINTGKVIADSDNPECLGLPLFAWAEYNMFHKTANKKRIKDVMPILRKYYTWVEENFKKDNGLYAPPLTATGLFNLPRGDCVYPIDFNAAMAINSLYMAALGDILNDKEISFIYKRNYFSLKNRINSMMWNDEDSFYYDLDGNESQIKRKYIGGFWPLLGEMLNEERAGRLIQHLSNHTTFGSENPFPSLSMDDPDYDKRGMGYRGAVIPSLTYMIIKGLEKYDYWEIARDSAIRLLYFILDSMHTADNTAGKVLVWEAYQPQNEGKAIYPDSDTWPRLQYFHYVGLATIAIMIENIIGLSVSLPRKTVDWNIPNLEAMGIDNLSLKRNMVTILSNKSGRGWEIHMESEKLYYFTINIIGKKKKTLPIPSGKCSMLIDKI